ncbi:NTP transferase domain-containing protein [Flavihumibacter petaseus]|uniref:Putative nucleotidyltransferase n=1 Tax=Flavihumibacter petaseus NBRC 106054 TaxID=1220578 RepID=A0A0E9MWS4_9BACT|nr:NTP transferase domain-containing protein [Flavihumibacter petaseus]GAO41948.1 putative nucleotidyltransferase [Flavihumibacter petaseus NBRC 106054]
MNAIILAAGLGSRMDSLTKETPKPLLKVGPLPIIETQICYLKEIGIEEIYVVVGYLKEQFNYLERRYGVCLINNTEFNKFNNIYSLYVAAEYFGDSYVLEGDVYLYRNILKAGLQHSAYFSGLRSGFHKEWVLDVSTDQVLQGIIVDTNLESENIGSKAYIMSGISFWNFRDALIIKAALNAVIEEIAVDDNSSKRWLFWDQLVVNNLDRLQIRLEEIGSDDWHEIDCLSELNVARGVV